MVPKALIKQGLACIMLLSAVQVALAQSGPNYASSVVNSNATSSVAWSDASSASGSSDDNATASVSLSYGNTSDYLKATDFGFSIPSGNNISGIQVGVEWSKTGGDIQDYEVVLVLGGSIAGSGNKATNSNLPSPEGTANYGSATDTWGQSLTAAAVNNSGFGVAIRVKRSDNGNSAKLAKVDRIYIKVYHAADVSGQISALAAQVAANTANISTNAGNIATNTADIADLQSDVSDNSAAISASNAAIAANTASIAANSADIASNTASIAANTSAISANTASIAANSADIASNSADISDLQSDVAGQAADIAANTAAIAADKDGDSTNEFNATAVLNGKKLDITDGGGTLSADLAVLANEDSDGDTRVHFEKNADEDIIRFDLAGTEKWVMKGSNLSPMNSGGSIFVGENAGNNDDVTDNRNIFIGMSAGKANVSGHRNIFIGFESGMASTTTSRNIYIGEKAGRLSVGSTNTFIGNTSGYNNAGGNYNVFMGEDAGYENTTGDFNTFYGYRAGLSNTTGGRNTCVGRNAGANNVSYSNTTALGYDAQNTASDQVRIGNSSVTSIGGFANWTNVSDARFKTNVTENVPGMDFIMNLRPVTYNLDMNAIAEKLKTPEDVRLFQNEAQKSAQLQTGFLAQEVEAAAEEAGYNFSGVDVPRTDDDFYGLRYSEFVVPMVKGMQEQQSEITKLSEKVAELESRPATTTNGTNGSTSQNGGVSECDRVKEQEMEIQDLKEEVQKLKQVISTIHPAATGIDILNTANVGLLQNQPNPFSEETVIGYTTPEGTASANILVFNMNGVLLMSVDVSDLGTGKITIRGEQLTPGMYIYSLIADGREIDTKRMILTE